MKYVLGTLSVLLLLVTSAYAEGTYRCECVGRVLEKQKTNLCGNGFIGGTRPRLEKGISLSLLNKFLPADLVEKVQETGTAQYSKESGWSCEPE